MTVSERFRMRKLRPIEVSFVPSGAVKEKRFLITKDENGGAMGFATDEIVKTIMEGNLENGEKLEEIAKEHQLTEDQLGATKAVLRLMNAVSTNIPEAVKAQIPSLAGYAAAVVKKEETKEGEAVTTENTQVQDKAAEERLTQVLKQNEDLVKSNEEMKAKLDAIEKAQAEEKEVQVQKEFVEKAGQFKNLGINAEEFGPFLKELSGSNPEGFEKLVKVLKSANDSVGKSGLLDEVGSGAAGSTAGDGSAMEQLKAMAAGLVQKNEKKMTNAEAMAEVLKSKEGRDLYNKYESERGIK